LRRGRGRKWAAAMFHLRRERAATAATEANGATCSLWRRRHANRDQWRIGRIRLDPACDLTLADKLRLISRRPAIGAHQNLVAAARSGAAAGKAVELDHPHAGARRTLLALRPRRTGRADRTGWTRRTGIALRAGRSGGPRIAFWALTTTGKSRHQEPDEKQTSNTHFFNPMLGTNAPPPHISLRKYVP
jgi:hypothetical protein